MGEKGISIFYALTVHRAPHQRFTFPVSFIRHVKLTKKIFFFFLPQIRKLKIEDEITHSGSHSYSLALRSMFFLPRITALIVKVFTGFPTLIPNGSLTCGLCMNQVSQRNLQYP